MSSMEVDSTSGSASQRKRRAAAAERPHSKRNKHDVTTSAMAELDAILREFEEQAVNKSADSSSTSVWIALNVVLDNSTFQKTLLAHDMSNKMENHVVPVVSRSYEEQYMRECVDENEKGCSMGQYCECNFIDENHSFVGVSFVMPEAIQDSRGLCILCLRKLTQMLFYRVQKSGYKTSHLIQTYGNLCDQPGEYHSSAMLLMPPHGPVHCMPLPVVAHQRSKYYVVYEDGVRRLKQRNVYVEDFC